MKSSSAPGSLKAKAGSGRSERTWLPCFSSRATGTLSPSDSRDSSRGSAKAKVSSATAPGGSRADPLDKSDKPARSAQRAAEAPEAELEAARNALPAPGPSTGSGPALGGALPAGCMTAPGTTAPTTHSSPDAGVTISPLSKRSTPQDPPSAHRPGTGRAQLVAPGPFRVGAATTNRGAPFEKSGSSSAGAGSGPSTSTALCSSRRSSGPSTTTALGNPDPSLAAPLPPPDGNGASLAPPLPAPEGDGAPGQPSLRIRTRSASGKALFQLASAPSYAATAGRVAHYDQRRPTIPSPEITPGAPAQHPSHHPSAHQPSPGVTTGGKSQGSSRHRSPAAASGANDTARVAPVGVATGAGLWRVQSDPHLPRNQAQQARDALRALGLQGLQRNPANPAKEGAAPAPTLQAVTAEACSPRSSAPHPAVPGAAAALGAAAQGPAAAGAGATGTTGAGMAGPAAAKPAQTRARGELGEAKALVTLGPRAMPQTAAQAGAPTGTGQGPLAGLLTRWLWTNRSQQASRREADGRPTPTMSTELERLPMPFADAGVVAAPPVGGDAPQVHRRGRLPTITLELGAELEPEVLPWGNDSDADAQALYQSNEPGAGILTPLLGVPRTVKATTAVTATQALHQRQGAETGSNAQAPHQIMPQVGAGIQAPPLGVDTCAGIWPAGNGSTGQGGAQRDGGTGGGAGIGGARLQVTIAADAMPPGDDQRDIVDARALPTIMLGLSAQPVEPLHQGHGTWAQGAGGVAGAGGGSPDTAGGSEAPLLAAAGQSNSQGGTGQSDGEGGTAPATALVRQGTSDDATPRRAISTKPRRAEVPEPRGVAQPPSSPSSPDPLEADLELVPRPKAEGEVHAWERGGAPQAPLPPLHSWAMGGEPLAPLAPLRAWASAEGAAAAVPAWFWNLVWEVLTWLQVLVLLPLVGVIFLHQALLKAGGRAGGAAGGAAGGVAGGRDGAEPPEGDGEAQRAGEGRVEQRGDRVEGSRGGETRVGDSGAAEGKGAGKGSPGGLVWRLREAERKLAGQQQELQHLREQLDHRSGQVLLLQQAVQAEQEAVGKLQDRHRSQLDDVQRALVQQGAEVLGLTRQLAEVRAELQEAGGRAKAAEERAAGLEKELAVFRTSATGV